MESLNKFLYPINELLIKDMIMKLEICFSKYRDKIF